MMNRHRLCLLLAVLSLLVWLARFKAPEPARTPASAGARIPSGLLHTPVPNAATQAPQRPISASVPADPGVPNSQTAPIPAAPPVTPSPRLAPPAVDNASRKLGAFNDWLARYKAADPTERPALVAEGTRLAQARREELADLIQGDPKRAIEAALAPGDRRLLPVEMLGLLEEPVSARGMLGLLAVTPSPDEPLDGPSVYRTFETGGAVYRAFVYGRRLGQTTLLDTAVNGIALDGNLAVDERLIRLQSRSASTPMAAAAQDPVCSVSGAILKDEATALDGESGGVPFVFCDTPHAALMEQALIEQESAAAPVTAASAYTEGTKRVLILRVDFSDLEGEPFTEDRAAALIGELETFFRSSSYGRAGFAPYGSGSDVTPTLRMPQSAAFYGANDASRLRTDARAAARAAGYLLTQFEFDLICFGRVPGFRWEGLGFVGAPGAWIRGTSSTGVCAHELGHNFGLNHANYWDTGGLSTIGPGTDVEYGDTFDTMGSSGGGGRHFNARYKSVLNWIRADELRTVTTNGTYRIVAHDEPGATGLRALRITRNNTTNYWVEFRQKLTNNRWLMNGAGLRWALNGSQSSLLLDTTPGSPDGKDDSAIVIGRTFSDPLRGLHITPIGKAGTTPEALDVVVNLGTFPGNRPPTLALRGPTTSLAVNAEAAFDTEASDPDGDRIAFDWTFGDATLGSNTPAMRHRWSATGEYLVTCAASDMKGGVTRRQLIVRVGTPSTFRIAGRISYLGQPLVGVRVLAGSTRQAITDTDGVFQLVGLPAGSYTVRPLLEGFDFRALSSTPSPIQVGPTRENIDFAALPAGGSSVDPVILAGSVWQYLDDGSNQGTAWTSAAYNDQAWNEGPAPLGYGDDGERTQLRYGTNNDSRFVTSYFRRRFEVKDPARFTSLTLAVRRDDGAAVYINGKEVYRSNLPSGTLIYTTLASSTVNGANETAFFEATLNPSVLVPGQNLICAEVHQASRTSSDLAFDLRLHGNAPLAAGVPEITLSVTRPKVTLAWEDPLGVTVLQSATALNSPLVWTDYLSFSVYSNGVRSVELTPRDGNRFFRVRVP